MDIKRPLSVATEQLLSVARTSHEHGICVVPPRHDGSKAPICKWKQYTAELSTPEQHASWYSSGACTGIGWVCGAVSGNLEVMDFDNRDAYDAYKKAAAECGLADLVEHVESGYLERSPHGIHWPYRCDEVEGNQVLAQRPMPDGSAKTLIETRGEGGYIVVAPTHGAVNADGHYELIRGSIETIRRISIEDRDVLHDLARSLDERPKAQPRGQRPRVAGTPGGNRPGEIFSREASWESILEPHGWIRVRDRGETTDWRRPGKKWGISATTNHGDSDCLYVFSSNASPFEHGRSYTKFGAFAELNHDGDYEAAASELGKRYGVYAEIPEETLAAIDAIAKRTGKKAPRAAQTTAQRRRQFPQHLLQVPGLVGEIKDWILSVAHKPQPALSLAASITAVATMVGRKVRTDSNLRSNIYVLAVAEPGDGKEALRSSIRKLFFSCNAPEKACVDNLASDAALINYVIACPCGVLLIDEIGKWISAITSGKTNPYQALITRELTTLYGVSDSTYHGKHLAATSKEEKGLKIIHEPCMSLFGTAPTETLYNSIRKENISDGFLSRLLIFEGEFFVPKTQYPKDTKVPQRLADIFTEWESFKHRDDGEDLDVEHPQPEVLCTTDAAQRELEAFDAHATSYQNNLRNAVGLGIDGIYARCATAARKLALIRAAGRWYSPMSQPAPSIEVEDVRWAIDLAWYLIDGFRVRAEESMYDSSYHRNCNYVRGKVRAAGSKGLAHSGRGGLLKACQMLRSKEINEIISHLIESGEVFVGNDPADEGKQSRRYFYVF